MSLMPCLICWQPLVKRQQAALSSQLSKQVERINLGLKEKVGCFSVNKKYSFLLLAVLFPSLLYQYSHAQSNYIQFTFSSPQYVQKMVLLTRIEIKFALFLFWSFFLHAYIYIQYPALKRITIKKRLNHQTCLIGTKYLWKRIIV